MGGPGGSSGAISEEMVKTLMDFDKDGDGKLTKAEVPERMQGLFDRGDLNKDGSLTRDELTKMARVQSSSSGPGGQGQRMEGRGGRGGFQRGDQLFATLDANSDGVLSPEEIRNAPAALLRLDRNRDGALTADEIRQIPTGTAR
jgi:Ca2+-binding EF-hand superfamily protein